MYHINKRQKLNYRLLTWDRHIHTECGWVKHISRIPLTWDNVITLQLKNEFTIKIR